MAVQSYKLVQDNAPDTIKNCEKYIDQYDDLNQRSVSKFSGKPSTVWRRSGSSTTGR